MIQNYAEQNRPNDYDEGAALSADDAGDGIPAGTDSSAFIAITAHGAPVLRFVTPALHRGLTSQDITSIFIGAE